MRALLLGLTREGGNDTTPDQSIKSRWTFLEIYRDFFFHETYCTRWKRNGIQYLKACLDNVIATCLTMQLNQNLRNIKILGNSYYKLCHSFLFRRMLKSVANLHIPQRFSLKMPFFLVLIQENGEEEGIFNNITKNRHQSRS